MKGDYSRGVTSIRDAFWVVLGYIFKGRKRGLGAFADAFEHLFTPKKAKLLSLILSEWILA